MMRIKLSRNCRKGRYIDLDRRAQLAFRTNGENITNDQHADHQFRNNLGGVEVTTRLHAAADVWTGSVVRFTIDMSKAVFFDPESGNRI